MKNILVRLKNLNVSYVIGNREVNLIRGVDLELAEGQILGIVGESGSGKSLTAKTLINLNHGSVTTVDQLIIDNVDCSDFFKKSYRSEWLNIRGKKIGYIPQDPMTSLNPTRKIRKQIFDSLILHRPEMKSDVEREEYAVKLLEQFGIKNAKERMNQYPHTFSGGMRQRIVIAMMVACNPKVLIADEPTTALDATVQASVLELFQEVRKRGVSIIFISHNIAVVAKLCDYIYVMYAGKVVEKATKKELFTNPKHPYTWALISAIPESSSREELYTIKGSPPNMYDLALGEAFAIRSEYAMKIDFEEEAPTFKVSPTHYVSSWLMHPNAPKVSIPENVVSKLKLFSFERILVEKEDPNGQ